MNVKELAEMLRREKYDEFCNALDEFSPRVLRDFLYDHAKDISDYETKLCDNVSPEQFKKWRYKISSEAENEYLRKKERENAEKGDEDPGWILYEFTDEEKRQACLI